MNDLEKELGEINVRKAKPGKRVDYTVKNARLKVIASKLIGMLFFLAIALFGMYTVLNAENAGIDFKVAAAMAIVYIALGAYVALKLWNTEFMGWLTLFFVSLAGIALPAMSAINHGPMCRHVTHYYRLDCHAHSPVLDKRPVPDKKIRGYLYPETVSLIFSSLPVSFPSGPC